MEGSVTLCYNIHGFNYIQEGGSGVCYAPGIVMKKHMIRQFYQDALKQEAESGKISRETKAALEELLKEMEAEDTGEIGRHRDELFLAACAAEENGFVKGFIYAFHLFTECVGA